MQKSIYYIHTAMHIARQILLTFMLLSRSAVCECKSLILSGTFLYYLCSSCTRITVALWLLPAQLWMGVALWGPGPELIKSSGRSPPPPTHGSQLETASD